METQSSQKNPLVSVAIVTFNQKKFLIEAIESVLFQDYPSIQIVVADDGSKDGTHDVLLSYQDQYPGKFKLHLSQHNVGITENHNTAYFLCDGKYIAWLGGDDIMLPGKISKQVKYLEENPDCSICYHNLDVFESSTNKTLYQYNSKFKPRTGNVKTLIKHGTFNGACSNMIRKECAPKTGFNRSIPVASDWLFWIETLIPDKSIHYIDEILGRYRRHSKNITNSQSTLYSQATLDFLNTCTYICITYPEYSNIALERLRKSIQIIRFNHNFNYNGLFLMSIQFLSIKCFIIWLVYTVSFHKLKI